MEKEIWLPVKGWEGVYEISNFGRLKSLKKGERILKNNNKKGWYLSVVLCRYGVKESTRIHRLVASHFVNNPDNKPMVNHKDLNKQNNHHENLEWCTCLENNLHSMEHIPERVDGMRKWNQEIKTKEVLQVKDGAVVGKYINCQDASNKTGVCARNIHQVASRAEYKPGLTRKQAGGFSWVYNQQ